MKKITLFACLVLIIAASSCKKYLDESPKSIITTTNFYQNQTDALAALSSIYATFTNEAQNMEFFVLSELPADDTGLPSASTATSDNSGLELLNYNASNTTIAKVWSDSYLAINRTNELLGRIDSSFVKPTLCRRIYAEARFLRAYYYFRLVRMFGDVPLITEELNSASSNLFPVRSSSVDVYSQIISDLKYAEINLDATYAYSDPNFGRATQGAAKSLLGKVYLTMAGFPINDISKLSLASAKLKEVIDNKAIYGYDMITTTYPVTTTTPYADIFDPAKKANNKEYIFSIRAINGQTGNGFVNLNTQNLFFTNRIYIPTTEIVKLYSTTDKRMTGAVVFKRKTAAGTVESTTTFSQTGTNPVCVGKYYDATVSGTAPNTFSDPRIDFPVLRYSDVLLLYAESLIEQNISLNAARDIINSIHTRAGLAAITYTSQDDLRQKLRLERRLELCFEGHRWFDLVRWGIFVNQMKVHGTAIGIPDITNNVSTKNLLLPLPANEIKSNNKLTQNPGY